MCVELHLKGVRCDNFNVLCATEHASAPVTYKQGQRIGYGSAGPRCRPQRRADWATWRREGYGLEQLDQGAGVARVAAREAVWIAACHKGGGSVTRATACMMRSIPVQVDAQPTRTNGEGLSLELPEDQVAELVCWLVAALGDGH